MLVILDTVSDVNIGVKLAADVYFERSHLLQMCAADSPATMLHWLVRCSTQIKHAKQKIPDQDDLHLSRSVVLFKRVRANSQLAHTRKSGPRWIDYLNSVRRPAGPENVN